jgi:hypothetical protein
LDAATENQLLPTESFTLILNSFGHLENLRGIQRFGGVGIKDSITHVFYMPYDTTVYELDLGTLWLGYQSVKETKEIYYKLEDLQPYGVDDKYLALYLVERGFNTNEANKA